MRETTARIPVRPQTRRECRVRKGDEIYDDYLQYLFELEDEYGETPG